MAGKTDVFRIVYNDGKNPDGSQRNHNALVFQEPEEGKAYKSEQMIVFGDQGQSSFASPNDEGVIPHREPTLGPDEDLGVTWHLAK